MRVWRMRTGISITLEPGELLPSGGARAGAAVDRKSGLLYGRMIVL